MNEQIFCQIAELTVEIPKAGGMPPRCRDYLTDRCDVADIVIRETDYEPHRWPGRSYEDFCYLESGDLFYLHLLRFGGMMLHASAVEYQGKAYLFSGPCGVGKSTHTRLWQQTFGEAVQVFNDDKPALRLVDGQWYAYGTPWCGKDGINQNKKVPLAGICFLKQARQNSIRKLSAQEAIPLLMTQTRSKFRLASNLELLLSHLDKLIRMIPIYELENVADADAARLSRDTMCNGE